jgi:SAM-dependent methyltransferase
MDHFPGSHDLPRRFCPACGQWTSRAFRNGPGKRPDARCPHCKSLERQRFLAVIVSCLKPVVGPVGTLLDIAPAPCTTSVLGELEPARHVRMDIGYDGRGVDVLGSVTAIPLADASVDVLVCYHVLEHVPGPAAAVGEARRVLGRCGFGFFGTPNRARLVGYIGGRATTMDKLRWNLADWGRRLTGRWSN